jgi:flagellin-like hook-associated protein FlgL
VPIRAVDCAAKADKAGHDRMVKLVDSMLALHTQLAEGESEAQGSAIQRQIDSTDAEIDRLVYALYGLTEAEIAIVEGEGR